MNEQEKLEQYFADRHMAVPSKIDYTEQEPPPPRFNPTERHQGDDMQEEYTAAGALDTGPDTPTRQEYAAEVDIHNILRRHGTAALLGIDQGENIGFYDEAIDLQTAIETQRRAEAAFAVLPEKLRKVYPSIGALIHAADNGTLDLSTLTPKQETTDGTKPPTQGDRPGGGEPA